MRLGFDGGELSGDSELHRPRQQAAKVSMIPKTMVFYLNYGNNSNRKIGQPHSPFLVEYLYHCLYQWYHSTNGTGTPVGWNGTQPTPLYRLVVLFPNTG
jgi:hypothetical protein